MVNRRAFAALVIAASACGLGSFSLDGKLCDRDGRCVSGYTCDPSNNVCVRLGPNEILLSDGGIGIVLGDGAVVPADPDGGKPRGDSGVTPTQDAGNLPVAWNTEDGHTTVQLNAVAVSDTAAYAVGNGGVALKRSAAGDWNPMPTNVTKDLFGVAVDSDVVWIVGAGGTLLKSFDAGGSFTQSTQTNTDLHGVAINNGTVYVVGAETTYMSGGMTSDPTKQPTGILGTSYVFASVWPLNNSSVHAVSFEGAHATLTTGGGSTQSSQGLSFTSVTGVRPGGPIFATSHEYVVSLDTNTMFQKTPVSFGDLQSCWAKAAQNFYAVGNAGAAYQKLGNLPWARLGTGTQANLNSVHGSDAFGTFAVGTGGKILKLIE